MAGQWLTEKAIGQYLSACPADLCDIIVELRDLVREVAPGLQESIHFNCLCYTKPGMPFGVIGGNACMIGSRGDAVHLAFIHGASLPDPDGLLEGDGKAKRYVPIRCEKDIRHAALGRLIRAAVAFDPRRHSGSSPLA